MRFNWVCVVTALVSIVNLCPRACGQEPIANIIPGQGRVVGLLEWIEAESTEELAEKIDPDRCGIILEGPDGRISGELEYSKGRLKFVPAGTRRVNMDDEAVNRDGQAITVRFEGTSIAAGVIQGPLGGAWDWRVDDAETLGGRFDLYLPTKQIGYTRYWEHTEVIAGDLENGAHQLRLTPAQRHPEAVSLEPSFYIPPRMSYFIVSPLSIGGYTAPTPSTMPIVVCEIP